MGRILEEIAKRCPGGKLPDSLCWWDTETSGVDRYQDRALQYGFGFAHQGKLINRFSQLVRRPGLYIHPEATKVHGITQERLDREGCDANWFVHEVTNIFSDWRRSGKMFGGHNLMAFDAPMYELESKIQNCPFKFGDNEIIDTGMIVKSAQLGMFMRDNESLRDFYIRVSEVRARGIYWSLDRHCYETFELERRTGIKKGQAHDAEIDCVLANGVLEALKEDWL